MRKLILGQSKAPISFGSRHKTPAEMKGLAFRKEQHSASGNWIFIFRLLSAAIVFFLQYNIFQTPLNAQTEKESASEKYVWDSDSSESRMSGSAAVSYCRKKGKKLPDMRELADKICSFRNSSGHWTSYVYPGGSRVFCACLKSGPVCSDQKENRKAFVRCLR